MIYIYLDSTSLKISCRISVTKTLVGLINNYFLSRTGTKIWNENPPLTSASEEHSLSLNWNLPAANSKD